MNWFCRVSMLWPLKYMGNLQLFPFLSKCTHLKKKIKKNLCQMPFVAKRAISYSVWSWTVFFNDQVELSCPKEMAWKVNMHRGYLAICHPEEQQLNFIERLVEMASSLAIREWRRLPHIVSHVHTPLLQVSNTQWMKSTVFFFLFWKYPPLVFFHNRGTEVILFW